MTDWYAKCDLANFRLEQRSLHMEDLVDECLHKLDYKKDSQDNDDPLVIAFVVLHEWYIGSVQLIDCVFRLLEKKPERWPSVVRLFNLWMQIYPQDFSIRSELREAIDRLRQWASGNVADFKAKDFPNMSYLSTSWSRYSSIKQPLSAKVSLSFDQWTPEDLAVNLTHIENKLLRRIPFRDYKSYAVNNHLNDESNLRKSIATFNSISQWIQCMILNKSKASERAEVITKFVRVAQNLKQLQNYNTLMAVVGALTHSAIARLSRTMVCVPNEVRLELLSFSNLLSSGSNFSVYRKVLCMSKGYRVPIIGVHLKDLISLHTAVPDYGDDEEINCQKFTQLFATFSHLIFDVQQPQQLPIPNESLTNTLKVALNIAYNDEEIYYLSLKREPKTLLQPSIQTSPVLADWAAGIQNRVDSSVMQKHVNAMVEAVFRHYDLNQDGYISKQEFDLIRSNFPLFDRFIALDSNRCSHRRKPAVTSLSLQGWENKQTRNENLLYALPLRPKARFQPPIQSGEHTDANVLLPLQAIAMERAAAGIEMRRLRSSYSSKLRRRGFVRLLSAPKYRAASQAPVKVGNPVDGAQNDEQLR
ncbi:hypothetical protein M513_09748 [Trichuris suis]|uniref:RasGEF domain protein n=1 Tax=Trichuris suis TaxID=68888 RepID=A0A085LWN9_9BILA|nr:hypothetical protein M513_09748 [Trichuris suis]